MVGVEWLRCYRHMERVWWMFRGSMAGLEVVRLAFGMGMPSGYNPQTAVRRRPAGMLVRSRLPLRLEACIGRMEPGIVMGEVLPLWQKGIEVRLLEVILFRSVVIVVVGVAAAWSARSMMALAPSTDAPSTV